MENGENITPDNDVFQFLAKLYANIHPTMHLGQSCSDDIKFKDGITNGAAWYQIKGAIIIILFQFLLNAHHTRVSISRNIV